MKTSVVAPLGVSPPIITEFLHYIDQVLGQRVTNVTIIAIKEPMVLEGVELVKVKVKHRYPHTHIHVIELPFSDIGSCEDSFEFMNIHANVLRKQRDVRHVNLIYLCVVERRKDMCITLSILDQLFLVNGIFRVIMFDVKDVNIQLECLRREIEELCKAEDNESHYKAHEKEFDELILPYPSAYPVIGIPVFLHPSEVRCS